MTTGWTRHRHSPPNPARPSLRRFRPIQAVAPPLARIRRTTRAGFTIDVAALNVAFNNAFVKVPLPVNQLSTYFVTVDLYRQERGANGAWGPPTRIKSVSTNDIRPYPGDQKQAIKADWLIYRTWVQASQELIIHPPFYPTASDVRTDGYGSVSFRGYRYRPAPALRRQLAAFPCDAPLKQRLLPRPMRLRRSPCQMARSILG